MNPSGGTCGPLAAPLGFNEKSGPLCPLSVSAIYLPLSVPTNRRVPSRLARWDQSGANGRGYRADDRPGDVPADDGEHGQGRRRNRHQGAPHTSRTCTHTSVAPHAHMRELVWVACTRRPAARVWSTSVQDWLMAPPRAPAVRRTPAMATGLRSLCGARAEPNWWSLLSHSIRRLTCLEPGAGLVACQDQLPALLVRRPLWSLVREQTLLKAQPAGGQAVPCLVPKPKPKPSRRSSASRGARSSRVWVLLTLSLSRSRSRSRA